MSLMSSQPARYRAEFLGTPAGADSLDDLYAALVSAVDAHMIVDTGVSNAAWAPGGIASVVVQFTAAGEAEAAGICKDAARAASGWSIDHTLRAL